VKTFLRLLAALALSSPALAQTAPTAVNISPVGAVIQQGTTVNYTVSCTYAVSPFSDNCAAAGGATWSTPTAALTLGSSSGATNTATWSASSTWDPNNTTTFLEGAQTAQGVVRVCADGVCDRGTMLAQSVDGGTTSNAFTVWITPWTQWYQDKQAEVLLDPEVVVGATVTVGAGYTVNNSGDGNPFNVTCNWTSSNPAVMTVNRYGLATAVSAPGGATPTPVTLTCAQAGNGAYDNSGITGAGLTVVLYTVQPPITSNTWYVRQNGGSPYVNGTQTPKGQCTGLVNKDYTDASIGGLSADWWHPATTYPASHTIGDANGFYETTASGGSCVSGGTPPAFSGSSTTDNTCVWTKGAAYPTDQGCAVGNLRDLWADRVTHNHDAWMIGGGDTVMLYPSSAGYNMNLDAQSSLNGGTTIIPVNCGDPSCYNPTVPSGSASNHTKILGANYASCQADSAKTQLWGSWQGEEALNINDSQYVDIACVQISQQQQCSTNGAFGAFSCGSVGANYSGVGIDQSALTADVTLTDVLIDGMASEAINGGSNTTDVYTRLHVRGNPQSGIDEDDIPYLLGNISVSGGLTLINSIVEFSGCVQQFPVVNNYPYVACLGAALNGYGDGFGTGSTTGTWIFNGDVFRYNWQDGLDLLHSGAQSISVTNSQSYGNLGNQYKLGAALSWTMVNDFFGTNCQRIAFPIGDMPPTAPQTAEQFCRAAATAMALQFDSYGTFTMQFNTIVGYGSTVFSYACSAGYDNCSTANTILQNNVVFANSSNVAVSTSQYPAGSIPEVFCAANIPIDFNCGATMSVYPANQGWATRDHNVFYNMFTCPSSLNAGEVCAASSTNSPGLLTTPPYPLTAEPQEDPANVPFQWGPVFASTLRGAGVTISGVTTDMTGRTRTSPPDLGAVQYNTTPQAVTQATGAGKATGSGKVY
jgi:hypothetical protein